MKTIIPLVTAAALLTGCPTLDEMQRIADIAGVGQTGNYYQMSQPYDRNAYSDGYQQGYRAGFYDAEGGRSYRPKSNYGGSTYNSAFSDGYYKGYEVGYYDSRDRRGYNLR
jgi:hypothetical protein